MKTYEIGILYRFQADDEDHAHEQLIDTLGDADSDGVIIANLNVMREIIVVPPKTRRV